MLISLFILTILIVHTTAHSLRSPPSLRRKINDRKVFSNSSALRRDDLKRDGTKYIFMHHIVGNTYSFSINDWTQDIQQIQSKGVDALALNVGSDSWQPNQVRNAYNAAQQLGTGFKLFLSLDFTAMPCNLGEVVSRVNQFSNHPNQFKIDGKVFVSSFSGGCLGDSGWANVKAQTNAYVMPFIWGLEGQFNNWRSLDSWFCWGCAWPQGNHPKTTNDDNYYLGQLGNRYATSISGWVYTHFGYKNFYLRGDDWLIVTRWEQLVAMRDQLTFVEMITWNDFGESDYFGPVNRNQPQGTTWATNFPHTAWFDLSAYYITAFKTGRYPTITKDVIYFWARPHPAGATASGDSLPKPSGWDWTSDTMWAVAFTTAPATVVLKCGSSSNTFSVSSGITKLKIPLSAGKMTVQMIRSGQRIIDYTPDGYTYVTNPTTYNYNAWVGSTTASTTSHSPRTSSPSNSGYTYLHCYQDDSARVLSGNFSTSSVQMVDICLDRCTSGGYAYAGLEDGTECHCANSLRSDAVQASEGECTRPCAGESGQMCGGAWRLSVYKSSASTASTTSTAPTPTSSSSSWIPYGCVAEGTTGSRRALTAAQFRRADMTPQLCQNLCSNHKYAGVEYGFECYCGDNLTNNGATGTMIPPINCPSSCGGDPIQKCGGSWTLNVFTRSDSTQAPSSQWTSAGCYTDSHSRVLRQTNVRREDMSTDQCISFCASAGYTMAGTEDGKECYCGSQFAKEDAGGLPTDSRECSTPCGGNPLQSCGGPWRMNVYLKPGTSI